MWILFVLLPIFIHNSLSYSSQYICIHWKLNALVAPYNLFTVRCQLHFLNPNQGYLAMLNYGNLYSMQPNVKDHIFAVPGTSCDSVLSTGKPAISGPSLSITTRNSSPNSGSEDLDWLCWCHVSLLPDFLLKIQRFTKHSLKPKWSFRLGNRSKWKGGQNTQWGNVLEN